MTETQLESIKKLLMVVVSLMVRKKNPENLNLKEQIVILNDMGIRPKDISEILGRTNTYVNKELVSIRKSKGKRR